MRNFTLTQTGQEVQDILNKAVVYGTTSYWESLPDLVPVEGQIVVYSDCSATEPGLKVGDGVTAVGALAFLGAGEAAALMQHIEDTIRHITASERSAWNAKQDAEPGKGLSTEDYTTAEKGKLAGIEAGADRSVNADWDASSGKAEVLHKPDLSQFVTKTVNDLVNYYLKNEVYTKDEVADLLAGITGGIWVPVSALPHPSADTYGLKIYLVPSQNPAVQNQKDEYITTRTGSAGNYSYAWEQIGTTAIDLSEYVTNEDLQDELENYVSTEAFQQAMGEVVLKVKVGTTEYTPSNGTVSLPAYPTTLPASDVYAWAKAQNPPQEIFWAIYGTTTANEIAAAISANKLIFVKTSDPNDNIGVLSWYDTAGYYYNFIGGDTVGVTYYKCSQSDSSWSMSRTNFGTYVKPTGGIPKTDLASAVQTSLGKADTAYQKPANGIPAADIESGVIPDAVSANPTVPSGTTPAALTGLKIGSNYYDIEAGGGTVIDVTVGGTSVVDANGVAVVPAIPTVPTISTDIDTDAASDAKTASPKAVKTFVEGKGYGTYSKPSGGIPSTDLASAVQTALGKADTALQSDFPAVKYTSQSLTSAQKAQARTNIGAADVINGITSAAATVDNTSGTPSVSVNLSNQQLSLAFTGLKGQQGNTGSSVDYPYELVNNLSTDDATKGLSAAQGVVLKGEISQLEAEIDGSATALSITERINGKYITNAGTTATLAAKSISEPFDVVEGDVLVGTITDVQAFITALAFYTGSDKRNFIPILTGAQTASGFVYRVTKTGKIVTCYDNSHIPTITILKSGNIRSLRLNVESDKDVLDAICQILGYGKVVSTPADDVTGKYISSSGVVTSYSGYVIKEGVSVKKGDYVIVDRVHAANVVAVAAIEVDGTYYPNAIGNNSNSVGKYTFIADRDGDLYVSYFTPYSNDYFGSPVTVTVYSADIVNGTPSPSPTPSVEGFEELQVVNLFDKSTVTKGKYIGTDGTLSDNSRYAVSDYIPVEVGKKYTYPTYYSLYGGNVNILNCYNENKERIGYVTGTADADYIVTTEITLTNTAFVRVTVLDTSVSTSKNLFNHIGVFMFVNAETLPDKYIPYGETARVADSATVNPVDGNEFNPLRGKTAIFIGDSICNAGTGGDTQDGWAGRIGTKNQMLFANKGVGGATFTKNTGWGTTCIAEMDLLGGPDYIIFEGGTNDADRIGSILNGNTPALFGSFDNKTHNTTFDNTTFCGAVEYLIKRILDNYPNSKVGYIVAPKMGATNNGYGKDDNNRRAYFETVMEICNKWGIPFINLWDKNPMNPSLASFYNNGDDTFYTDGQHLTSKGYDRISPQIEAWMKTL